VSGDKTESPPPDRGEGDGFVVPVFTRIDAGRLHEQLARDQFFWLDLTGPSEADVERLGEIFKFHPLALEDTIHFGQRPKLDDYRDHVLLVFYGAREQPDEPGFLREVHLFVSGQYIVTVHREPLPALEQERRKLDGQVLESESFVLYRILDALTDTFFPVLSEMDEEIDELEAAVVLSPTDDQLQRLFALKRELVGLRKVVTPQRDLLARSIDQLTELPGLVADERDYFRDVYDHLIRISDLIDSYRDLLSSATDLYLSTVSNRQNAVMKQLTVIATVFLPLSFIVGFFGMNFGWLVQRAVTPEWTFWVFGVGTLVVTCVLLLVYFKRKDWL
jgi:magnesium transporter